MMCSAIAVEAAEHDALQSRRSWQRRCHRRDRNPGRRVDVPGRQMFSHL
jgi:hypothetical protein